MIRLLSLTALGLLVVGSGCAPKTVIRRSALIPAASAPARTGGPLERGQARLSGHVNAVNLGGTLDIEQLFPDVGDPGVFIPDFHLGASAWFGLPVGLELGVQFQYANLDWAHRNSVGVLSFPPEHERDLWMGGFGVRYNLPLRVEKFDLSFIGEFNFAWIPQAVFLCEACLNEPPPDPADEIYVFQRIDTEMFVLPNVALQGNYRFLPELSGYAMLGVQRSVTNVGFDNSIANLQDDTLEGFVVGYFGVGVEAQIEAFVANATFYFPFDAVDRIDFGPSFAFSVGANID